MALLRPHNEDALKAYLSALVPSVSGLIGTTLPEARATWSASGFVRMLVVGGSGAGELLQRRPVFRLECFANAGDSPIPPWSKATALAEDIRELGERRARGVVLGNQSPAAAAFLPFVITNFLVLSEPRPLPGDVAAYARVTLDVELWWSPVGRGI